MTFILLWLIFMADIPAIFIPFAMLLDTIIIVTALLTGNLHFPIHTCPAPAH